MEFLNFSNGQFLFPAPKANRLLSALAVLLFCILFFCYLSPWGFAQNEERSPSEPLDIESEPAAVPEKIDVQPVAHDEEIAARLQKILISTNRYFNPQVTVENGVVFLQGQTRNPEHKVWATNLAQRTQDVVAVVNQITVIEPVWDFSPMADELRTLWRQTIKSLPLLGISFILLLITLFAAKGAAALSRRFLRRRMNNRLLMGVLVKVISIPVIILGVYIMLRVSGLTRLALTLLGGTGIAGLIIGIAFQDIAENFLASLLISVNNPFRTGDLIEINGMKGYVQKVTTRGTVLMAFDGYYIQIPNSTVYKSIIRNYSANPNMRLDFTVGIGYDSLISQAQEIGLRVMREHPAVLHDPTPMVLVDDLGSSTINLHFYFWIDSNDHSFLRVKSSVIRLVVRAFLQGGVNLPDEAREVIFPRGVPVRMLETGEEATLPAQKPSREETDEVATAAEGDMKSEAFEVQTQAQQSELPESGQDLLKSSTASSRSRSRS